MTEPTIQDLETYAERHSSPESPALAELARRTAETFPRPGLMIGPLGGRFLAMLVAATGARRVLEIGTFSGYSALSMAEALPPDGTLVTCELSEEHARFARRAFDGSPYADRIELQVGPALESIARLDPPFDLVFIDADKPGYPAYLDAVLPKLSERGLIAVDDALQGMRDPDDPQRGEQSRAVSAFNARVAADPRLESVLLPFADGITLIRKRR